MHTVTVYLQPPGMHTVCTPDIEAFEWAVRQITAEIS